MVKNIINNPQRLNKIILVFFILILISQSLGSILRWELNEMIGMADNFLRNNSFYPSDQITSPYSIYPPGVSFISYFFLKAGINEYLTEFMLVVASLIFILTCCLFLKISKSLGHFNKNILPFIIIYTLMLCGTHLSYALEFKPDTLSLLFCYFGFYLYNNEKNYISIILGALLIGSSILFKQQSIAFLAGLILFTFYNYNDIRLWVFMLLSVLFYTIFTTILYSNSSVMFYTFEIIADDGFTSLEIFFRNNWHLFKRIVMFLIVILLIKKNISENFKININNPYLFFGISILLVSLLSSIKNGGNNGNTELGLFFLIPCFFEFASKIDYKKLIFSCMLILIINVPLGQIIKYYEYNKTKNILASFKTDEKQDILTDSSKYSLSRNLLNNNSEIFSVTNIFLEKGSKGYDYFNAINFDRFELIILSHYNILSENLTNHKLIYKNSNIIIYSKK